MVKLPTFPDEEEQRDAAANAAAAAVCNASSAGTESGLGLSSSSGPVSIPGAAGRPSPGGPGSRKSSQQWRRESVTIIEGVEEPGTDGSGTI